MSSGFDVIRRHARDATSIRIKELAQQLAKTRSDISGSQLETDDVRSEGRMDHSTIKLNDERLKFITLLDAGDTDFFYEFPTEPDLNYLKVWFMLDHLGSKMRDMSCLGNDAFIAGHPTLRRVGLDLGFQQTSSNGGGGVSATPVMLFNSGTDVVSQRNGEYIWVPDNPSIQFTQFPAGFSIAFRFNCLNFNTHTSADGVTFLRRFAAKTDNATNGWSILVNPSNAAGTTGSIEMEVKHNNVNYSRFVTGFSANVFYQVVITYNPNITENERIKIYVAGVELSQPSDFGTILPTHPNLRIGARDSETGFFHGYIHDFRLYMGKVLTQAEVTNLNQNELTIDNIPKGHVFVVQYSLVSQSLRSRTHKYHMTGRVKKSRVHKYYVIKKLTRSKTHKFSLLVKLTKSKTHKYNTVQKVTRTRTHKFNMGGELTVNKTHKFNILNKITKTKTHKYNLGGLRTQYQRFQKSTTAGSNIVQEITFTSTPQAILVWSDGNTQDNTFANQYATYYGFSDGTHHACVSGISKDFQTTTDSFSGHKNDKVISLMDNTVGSMVAEATVSFEANKATFTWTTNDNRAVYIHCLALWGANNVEVKTFEVGTTNTGIRVYSLNNSSLVPKLIHTITRSSTLDWSTSTGQAISIGASTGSTKQFAVVNVNEDGSTGGSDVYSYFTTSALIQGHDDDSGIEEMSGSLNAFGTGSFTINWIDPPPTTTRVFSALVVDSPNVDVGMITQPTSTGTQVVNTASTVDTVKGVMIFSNAQTTSGVLNSIAALSIGGASGISASDQGVVATGENDGVSPSETARINKTGSVIKTISVNGTVASSTTTSEAAVSALGTDQFSLNWTTANATQRKSHYMVFGS